MDVVSMHHEQFEFSEAGQGALSDLTDSVKSEERTQY